MITKNYIKNLPFWHVVISLENSHIDGQNKDPTLEDIADEMNTWIEYAVNNFKDGEPITPDDVDMFKRSTNRLLIYLAKRCIDKNMHLWDVFINSYSTNVILNKKTTMARIYIDESLLNDEEREQFKTLREKCEIDEATDFTNRMAEYIEKRNKENSNEIKGKSV